MRVLVYIRIRICFHTYMCAYIYMKIWNVYKNNCTIAMSISAKAKSDNFYIGLFETLKRTYQTKVAAGTL